MNACVAVARPVFVQPHYDDVALSCGGTVAAHAQREGARIVTIFGGDPGHAASEFARFQHARWNLEDNDVIAVRRAEDARAAAELGDQIDVIWFTYLDAIYRHPDYASDDALFGSPVAADCELVTAIAARLAELGDRFVLPLAVGNHVDHQLAFLAGGKLLANGRQVWLYADMPYALNEGVFESRLRALGDPAPCVRSLSTDEFERRWSAIECYGSQLPVIFRDLPDARERFERFAADGRGEAPIELFWNMADVEGRRT